MGVGLVGCCGRAAVVICIALPAYATALDRDPEPGTAYFVDATREAGIDFVHTSGAAGRYYLIETMGAGAGFVDYDGDGLLDVYLVNGFSLDGIGEELAPVNLVERTDRHYHITHTNEIVRDTSATAAVDPLVYAVRQSGDDLVGNRLYRNRDGAHFSDVTEVTGVGDVGYGMGCAIGDYDNDGDPDLYVVNYGANTMYRNESPPTGPSRAFVDVTNAVGGGDPRWGAGAAFFDYDGDGMLDLYVVNYLDFDVGNNQVCGVEDASEESPMGTLVRIRRDRRSYCSPDRYRGAQDVLYHNTGNGFADGTTSGIFEARGKGLGVVTADYDSDGDTDLYVANDGVENFLYRNDGGGRFSEVSLAAGVAYNGYGRPEAGMGVDWGDFDGDADWDLFVTNYSRQTNTLYRNEGAGRFADITDISRLTVSSYNPLGFGTFFFEADNDGDVDLFVANGHVHDKVQYIAGNEGITYAQPNQLLENRSGKVFVDVSDSSGPGLLAELVSRGSAFGDYDNDGDLDILVTNCDGPAQLMRNDLSPRKNWLSVRLIGTSVNRDAVGSRIAVTCDGRTQVREVRTNGSYASASDIRQHFGLGDCDSIESLEIIWHDGSVQMAQGEMAVNEFVTIVQQP